MKQKILLISSVLLLFMFSCKKDNLNKNSKINIKQTNIKESIPAYVFDWETADYMPTPAGTTSILVPWASGSNQQFTPDIRYDFKKSDGWELVYNTFNPNTIVNPRFMALYNKYRGILRIYSYLPPDPTIPSDYLIHGLSLSGAASSSMLNFLPSEVVDPSINVPEISQIQNARLVTTGAWYAETYEIAYDPNISSLSQNSLSFVYKGESINITDITINGTLNTEVKTPVAKKGGFNLGGAVQSGVNTFIDGVSKLPKVPNGENKTGFGHALADALNTAISQVLGSGGSIIKGLLSGIFGGSSATPNFVNVAFNANVALHGGLTDKALLWNPTLTLPGIQGSQTAPGYVPYYDQTMGVFNISNKPTITASKSIINDGTFTGSSNYYTFSIDRSSYSLIYNPAISGSSTISNVKESIILLNVPYEVTNTTGTLETLDTRKLISFGRLGSLETPVGNDIYSIDLGLRVSFDVVPNNGSPKTTIVKTFKVNAPALDI